MFHEITLKSLTLRPGITVYATFSVKVESDGEVTDWDVEEAYLEHFGEHRNLMADFPYPRGGRLGCRLEWLAKAHPEIEEAIQDCFEKGVVDERRVREAA